VSEDLRRERLREPISRQELERRWKAVREAMAKQRLDCLEMRSTNRYLGGYVRYFVDIPAQHSYPMSIIFPLRDGMTLISHGGPPLPVSPPEWALHGVKRRIVLPYLPTLNFTNTMEAQAIAEAIRSHNVKRLGVVSKAAIAASVYEYLRENLADVDICDATDMVDEIKAVKSEEEIRLIKKTAELQDRVFAAILASVRPGVREYELRSEIQRLAINLGSEQQLIMIGSAPAGTPAGQLHEFYQNRTLRDGDCACIMIEVNGLGGFYCEIGRTVCVGDAPRALLDTWDKAVVAQDKTAELMKPGAKPEELIDTHNKLLGSMGYPLEGRLFSHGQGYDLVERPGICPGERMTIKSGMNIVIHPTLITRESYAFCCDNYLITESGAVRIHKTPREVFVV